MTNFSHLNANGNVFWLKPHSKPGGEIRRIFHSALVKTNRKRVLVFENFIYELLGTWDLGQDYIQAQLNIRVYFRVMILFYSSWRNIIERSTLEGASSAGLNMVNWSAVCGCIVIFMQYFCFLWYGHLIRQIQTIVEISQSVRQLFMHFRIYWTNLSRLAKYMYTLFILFYIII